MRHRGSNNLEVTDSKQFLIRTAPWRRDHVQDQLAWRLLSLISMRSATYAIALAAAFIAAAARADSNNPRETRVSGDATKALIAGEFGRALSLSEEATRLAPQDPWPFYTRASALVALHRTAEAIANFRQAEKLFGDDHWARSVSIFGRARAYELAGDCVHAAPAFQEYANFVSGDDPQGAQLARRYAGECPTRQQPAIGGGPNSR